MKPIAPIVALLVGLPLLTSLGCAFIEGLLPQPGIDILQFPLNVATFLLGAISHFWQKRNNPKSSLLTWLVGLVLILILGSQAIAGVGFLFRPALFAWARPELNHIAKLYKDDRLPIRLGEKPRASEPDQ
ncbi:hypothetical protein [Armatimonas rosea]|uniref:Uncharacterized protein n=1 Tax=Armatimonas rosea TaxID=685828 RepID=A0A7W9W691_ARMRO|nr:hypothetical protein [Armatimonas rosea]MBB6049770.1 hypothetical protein [Armatimonas rosea]